MPASENRFLIVKPGVSLTPIIEPVIIALDEYFERQNLITFVTSGFRSPEDQLKVIRSFLVKNRLDQLHAEAMMGIVEDKLPNDNFVWQMGWSNLLNIGIIINPPLPATCLMNYIVKGVNKKGKLIGQTPHARGKSFDIGGSQNGIMDELTVLTEARQEKKIPGFVSFLVERKNNAIHVDCK